MDLSLFENFQTLINTSLQSIIDDAKIQYCNLEEELNDKIFSLNEKNKDLNKNLIEIKEKLDEQNFCEDNFNRVSIISNLNKQIKSLQNENSDLRNCLNKNIPINQSLAKTNSSSSLTHNVKVADEEALTNEEAVADEEVDGVSEIEYKNKIYYVIDEKLYNKKKNGSKGKLVGKMDKGIPKLKKKKKKEN